MPTSDNTSLKYHQLADGSKCLERLNLRRQLAQRDMVSQPQRQVQMPNSIQTNNPWIRNFRSKGYFDQTSLPLAISLATSG